MSHLFYQSRLTRPTLDRAEGIYLWDTDGKRYLDGSSGAMVSNIGHSNPRVLDAMRAQMDAQAAARGARAEGYGPAGGNRGLIIEGEVIREVEVEDEGRREGPGGRTPS